MADTGETQVKNDRNTSVIGEKIRAFRGDESQEEFSKKLGISRAMLANYETGRTTPKLSIFHKITRLSETIDNLVLGEDASEFLRGFSGGFPGGFSELLDDEKVMLRLLRLCREDTVLNMLKQMLTALEANEFDRKRADPMAFYEDLERLVNMVKTGSFTLGATPDMQAAMKQAFDLD